MRACVIAVCSLLILTGCRTLGRHTPANNQELSKQEQALAEALAHYAQGLIDESELGRGSPETLQEFLRAIERDPKYYGSYSKAALAALYQRDIAKALHILEDSCRANPSQLQPRLDLAVTYQITGQVEPAIESFRKALDIDPTQAFSYIALSRLYFYKNQDDKALDVLERGLHKAAAKDEAIGRSGSIPRFQVFNLIGELQASLTNDAAAVEAFTAAIAEAPDEPDSYVRLATFYLRSNPTNSVSVLLRADRRMPNKPGILLPLAFIYSTMNRLDDALEVFDVVQSIVAEQREEPLSPDAYLHFAALCDRNDRPAKAEEILQKAIAIYPDSHEVLNYVAYTWAERGVHLEQALAYVEKALKQQPGNGAYIDTLGWIYYKMGKHRDALEQIRRASEILKDDPTVIEHLGDILSALGDKSEAVKCWQRSFLLDPKSKSVADKLRGAGLDPDLLPREPAKRPAGSQEAPGTR